MTDLLAIDASTEQCSVALHSSGDITERSSVEARSHAKRLLPMVDELLAERALRLTDLDAIAFGAGPGSFTGLRICVGVAQGLGFAADVPLVPVSSLQALAQAEHDECHAHHVICALDARMSEVYWAAYQIVGGYPDVLVPPRVSSLGLAENELREWLSARSDAETWSGVGSGFHVLPAVELPLHRREPTALPTASAIARLGLRQFAEGRTVAAEAAEPLYLRNEIAWQKRPPARR